MSYILVTGAANNIGREISLLLAEKGYNIVIHYRESEVSAISLKEEIERKYRVKSVLAYGDFSSKKGIDTFISSVRQKVERLKGIVNSASIYKKGSLIDTSYVEFEEMTQVNLTAPFYLVNSFLKDLLVEDSVIINLGICGLLSKMADTYAPAYQMTKLSFLMLTKSYALSLAKNKIRVNMVSPGYSETSVDLPVSLDVIPLKRLCLNKEIAETVLFLIEHKYITGQNIEVAGGMRL